MLDMEDIYQMVHNQATIKRAIDYVHEGRILFIDRQSSPDGERYMAKVRGHYGVYETWYEETNQGRFGADAPAWRMRARTRRASTSSR